MSPFHPNSLLITGGAGFIGSAVVRRVLAEHERDRPNVIVLDALTYAGHEINLEGVSGYHFEHGDISDRETVARVFQKYDIDAVLHLAAESHVDRSIESADVFVRTNVNGTFVLLEAARHAWSEWLVPAPKKNVRFVHVSTDEVFGALGDTGFFTEATAYAPNSPYAASKAASDLLVRSYFKTYELPAIITNCCNNYGPRQLPEKLVPLMITNAAARKPLPVYGEGRQIREWLHVEDHVEGLWAALTRGSVGESYLFGSGEELNNKAMVECIADAVDGHLRQPTGTSRSLMQYVLDRKGHDFRYAIDSSKARNQLEWRPTRKLQEALFETVGWYLTHETWRKTVASDEHVRFQRAMQATSAHSR